MPQGDGTGPNGAGPMTGRAMGYCAGYNSPGFTKGIPAGGRGFCRGFGRGRGFAWRARAFQQAVPVQTIQPIALTKEQEKKALEQEKELLKQELEAINQEMQEIEKRLKKQKK